jgi:ketosteroid isomerase-like protein
MSDHDAGQTGTGPSPREVFLRVLDGIVNRRFAELPELYAEDAVVQHPFAPEGPTRLLEGREALRRHFAQAAGMPIRMSAKDVVVHETTDPEVIIAEFVYRVEVTTTGKTFELPNIFVYQVRNGHIVRSRDYANHAAFAGAF